MGIMSDSELLEEVAIVDGVIFAMAGHRLVLVDIRLVYSYIKGGGEVPRLRLGPAEARTGIYFRSGTRPTATCPTGAGKTRAFLAYRRKDRRSGLASIPSLDSLISRRREIGQRP